MCDSPPRSHDASRPKADAALTRRGLLHRAALGAGAMTMATLAPRVASAEWMTRDARRAPLHDTPDEVLASLMEGNARFAEGRIQAPHRNVERLKEVAHGQEPKAAFLGCSDSRVPIEIVFDQGFGDVFVVRDAGNVISPEVIASLEFGTLVLGAQLLFVLGHSGCGAVTATLKGEAVPGQISALYSRIQPAVDAAGGSVASAIEHNVRLQAQLLRRSSPVLRDLVTKGALRIAGGVYDLASGRVRLLDV